MSSPNQATQTKNWIQLRHGDQGTGVMVTPEDEDRFGLTMKLAIEGCKLFGDFANFQTQFGSLLNRLAEWATKHEDEIDQWYIGFRDSGWLFLVHQKTTPFNETLEDDLINLDIEIAQNPEYNLIQMSVLSLPDSADDTLRSFLPKDYLTYKNAGRTDTPCDRESQSEID